MRKEVAGKRMRTGGKKKELGGKRKPRRKRLGR